MLKLLGLAALYAVVVVDGSLSTVIAVSRHSIKSFVRDYVAEGVSDKADIDQDFGAPNGDLTPHGREYAVLVGKYYREYYGPSILSSTATATCAEIREAVMIFGDEDQRDTATGDAFLEGFAPDCRGQLQTVNSKWTHKILNEGKKDMLYESCTYANEAEVSGLIGGDVEAFQQSNFDSVVKELGALFGCCNHSLCGAAGCTLDQVPNEWVGGYWDTWEGGLSHAAHLAVTLQTQLVNNNTVFGNVSADKVSEYYRVAQGYWSTYKNPINKNRFGGNLMAYLLAALQQAATGTAPVPHLPVTVPRLQWYLGHDVNVAFTQQFLQGWFQSKSYPSKSSSVFFGQVLIELHQDDDDASAFTVQVFQQTSSMLDIRNLAVGPMDRSQVSIPFCSDPLNCDLAEFLTKLADDLDPRCMDPELRPFVIQSQTAAGGAAGPSPSPSPATSWALPLLGVLAGGLFLVVIFLGMKMRKQQQSHSELYDYRAPGI